MPSFHRFFDLPPELRAQILSHLLPAHQTLPLSSPTSHPPLPLLLAHPLIHLPTAHAFFALNTFASTPESLALLPRAALLRLRNLTVSLPRLREALVRAVTPLLSDALLNGSLRRLRIELREGGISLPNGAGAELPAGLCAELAGVLADPYLEGAELWVGGVHRAGWCEFHPGTECWVQGGRGRRGPVEIDWRLMAGRLGGEVSIVAVGR